nr:MAG: hypothetical protein [Sclerotinia sclerotiorum ophiovirus like virus 1]
MHPCVVVTQPDHIRTHCAEHAFGIYTMEDLIEDIDLYNHELAQAQDTGEWRQFNEIWSNKINEKNLDHINILLVPSIGLGELIRSRSIMALVLNDSAFNLSLRGMSMQDKPLQIDFRNQCMMFEGHVKQFETISSLSSSMMTYV